MSKVTIVALVLGSVANRLADMLYGYTQTVTYIIMYEIIRKHIRASSKRDTVRSLKILGPSISLSAPRKDSSQSIHIHRLIKDFAVRLKNTTDPLRKEFANMQKHILSWELEELSLSRLGNRCHLFFCGEAK